MTTGVRGGKARCVPRLIFNIPGVGNMAAYLPPERKQNYGDGSSSGRRTDEMADV